MKIIGFRLTAFETQDGKNIRGTTFFCTREKQNENEYGEIGKKFFVSENRLIGKSYNVGDNITPIYNEYGKIQDVNIY